MALSTSSPLASRSHSRHQGLPVATENELEFLQLEETKTFNEPALGYRAYMKAYGFPGSKITRVHRFFMGGSA